ncbi:efflux RND transporter permease subunit [Nitritalea halalkaliphila]|uniref:efflux RND transporter permease subunit n=1 Tax=Nitritalea halalkaliphila TaxID=590849 RepID=UPI0003191DDC|nr:efflux RND transporter permease subunit [Nitritalea halalkaliphila]
MIEINWNEPIGPLSNKNRVQSLLQELEVAFLQAEADIGLRQFLLFEGESSLQQASLYMLFSSEEEKERGTAAIRDWVRSRYPSAGLEILDAPNAFDQLFASDIPYYEVRFRDLEQNKPVSERRMQEWLSAFPTERFEEGPGLLQEAAIVFRLDQARMAIYGINPAEARDRINKLFGNFGITDIKRFGEITPIRLQLERKDFETMLRENTLLGRDEVPYALYNFVQFDYENQYKFITADKNGIFQSVFLEEESPERFADAILDWGRERNLGVDFFGQYFIDQERIQELLGILFIAVLLLYFILAAQFESFVQPLIVILTLPLGIGGAFVVLLLTGTSLNIMSAIGMVVMLGIMVNDAILKIDTTNRLHVRYAPEMGGRAALDRALYEAGEIRLKPIMMTSVTTILALLPVIFSSGLGADLQRPLVFSVLGGLTIGTFTALYFVPLSYYFLGAKRKLLRQPKPETLTQS